MTDLFSGQEAPLADRMRPRSLSGSVICWGRGGCCAARLRRIG